MKINLSKHNIISRSKKDLVNSGNVEYVGLKELPLSYVNTEEVHRNPLVSIKEGFVDSSRHYVRPYDSFNDEDTYLFDKNNEVINVTMKRVGNTYYYEPSEQVEFTPMQFRVYMDIQKNESYFNNKNYNIKVSAIEVSDNQSFVNKLISIFADKYIHGDCPSNIRINGGAKSELSLIEQDYRTADFVFIESDDGIHIGSGTTYDEEIDFDYILKNHTNIWLSVGNYEGRLKMESDLKGGPSFTVKDAILYKNKKYKVTRSQLELWDQSKKFIEGQGTSNETYEYINEAILLIHRKGQGYIVVTPKWFFDSLSETMNMVYEVMIRCYLKQYYKSREAAVWITDEPVDYLAYHEDKFNRTHKKVTVDELMLDYDFNYNNYNLINVAIDTPNVQFLGINDDHELLFIKVGGESDPVKEMGEQSFYTTKHTVINYKQEDVSLVETPLDVSVSVTGTDAYVIVKPMISSSHKILTKEQQTFKITDFTDKYKLYVNRGSTSLTNTFYLIGRKEIPEDTWTEVATIEFESTFKIVACDTRIMGGGLPDGQPDDYDMLDIGHVNGRPYRLGSAFIIRVPKKISNYESRIRTELDKHISAGDEYVLVFE